MQGLICVLALLHVEDYAGRMGFDDFRTEILGLVKTQQTKNVVIVPVGSKGGFVLKNTPVDREEAILE
ncbi:MAG: hypothetical protein CM1200mP30_19380 [Pseudomonadota bacterium]|nr:MAG: hypothetical protein CM1200mP30_19380 [Pseudomonadota bacterium]